MRFGSIPLEEAEGAVLAHRLSLPGLVLEKGRRLGTEELGRLRAHGVAQVVAALAEPGDVAEDEAAARLAGHLVAPGIRAEPPFTGRVNLFAEAAGVLLVDAGRVSALNALDEAVTLATPPPFAAVEPGQMVATVKIIPFAVPAALLERCEGVAREAPLLRLAPYRRPRIRLIQTELPGTAAKMLDKTVRVTEARVRAVSGTLAGERRCPHAEASLARAIGAAAAEGFDILLIAGASAITDRRDVLPAAVEAAGGRIVQLGMPVDPGNLLLLAELGGRPVLGLPGCARSPRLNGFDWVLQRLAAGLEVTAADIRALGVGGLLMEIPSRPQPREARAVPTRPPRLAAVLLAAGRSTRMGGPNKLLVPIDGKPMVRHAAEAALAAGVAELVVVVGHMREEIERALAGLAFRRVVNRDYASGLASSLKAGIEALGPEVDGAFVLLGDMPRIGAGHLQRLASAFDPAAGRAIVVPTRDGRRGNPVLWGRAFLKAFQGLEGDVGARHLIAAHPEAVVEVEMPDEASLLDIDTPEALAALGREPR